MAPSSGIARLVDFEQVYTGQLRFPYAGREYVVQPIGVRTGALLRVFLDEAEQAPDTEGAEDRRAASAAALEHLRGLVYREEHDGPDPGKLTEKKIVQRAILGAAYWSMYEDDVPEVFIDRAEITALSDFAHDRVRARQAWGVGGDPKALALIMGAAKMILAS